MIHEFICGCTIDVEKRAELTHFDRIDVDAEGMLYCIDHYARRKGWRSVPERIKGYRDMAMLQFSPAQIEALVVFGEQPKVKKIEEVESDTPDRRPDTIIRLIDSRGRAAILNAGSRA